MERYKKYSFFQESALVLMLFNLFIIDFRDLGESNKLVMFTNNTKHLVV